MISAAACVKPLLVGEANPYGSDPRYALYPEPRGASGDRLCRLVMGLEAKEYIGRFDRVNLCPSAWSVKVARVRARKLIAERADSRSPVVLLGSRVTEAFGFAYEPYTVIADKYLVLPHPSGLSRAWNEANAFHKARAALKLVGAL